MSRVVRSFVVIAIAGVIAGGVLGGATVSAATGPVLKPVSATLVAKGYKDDNCHWAIGVVFGNYPGAASYVVSYWDGYYKQVTTQSISLAQLDAGYDPKLMALMPKGKHFTSATGGGGGGSECVLPTDPTEGGRFSKGAKAWAVLPANGPKAKISGTVEEISCNDNGCSEKGLAGVRVTAGGAGGGSATTARDGTYSFKVTPGIYRVTPALGGHEFDPPNRNVTARSGGTATANFLTCARVRTTQSVGAKVATDPCAKIDVAVLRVRGSDDSGWVQTSGKSYLGKGAAVKVGFTRPVTNGDFTRHCVSGCYNVRLKIKDSKTGHFVPNAHVVVSADVAGKPITPFSKNGVFCRAGVGIDLDQGCKPKLDLTLDSANSLDFYYWTPGVVESTKVVLTVSVKAPKYRKESKQTVTLTVNPNVAYSGAYTVQQGALLHLNTLAPVIFGFGKIDIADYCQYYTKSLIALAGSHVPAGMRQAVLKTTQALSRTAKGVCGVAEMGAILPKVKHVTSWVLYWFFTNRLGVPPSGLVGNPRLINFVAQMVLEYSGFYDAFLNGLQSWVYSDFDPANPDASLARTGDRMKIRIYEVSYRGESSRFGSVQDALYLTMDGTKKKDRVKPFEAYVEGGYWPGCWLDPALQFSEFYLPVGTNPCNLDDV